MVPVEGPPIEDAAVEIRRGIIMAVGPAGGVGQPVTDLGDVVLLPGFVNAHTHLELSRLAGRVPTEGGFVDWIGRLTAAIQTWADAEPVIAGSIRAGVRQSLAAGVTAVGDITRRPLLTRPVLRDGLLRVVSFGEVIALGSLRKRLAARLADAADCSCASERMRIGVSPHSPYTVEPEGLRACVRRAEESALPLCIHLAETPEEAAFTQRHEGPLREALKRAGVWDDRVPCPGQSPVELAAASGVLRGTTILAHVNYASDDEILRIAGSGAHVAYCPRTHRAFGHPPHRFRDMLAAGINVCVGTDSLASNPSLSVLDELRFLRGEHPDVSAETLIGLGTMNGAQALGWADRIGSLTPGKDADLVAVSFDPRGAADPLANILRSSVPPVETWVRGRRCDST